MSKYFKVLLIIVVLLNLSLPFEVLAGKITGSVKVKGLRSPAEVVVFLSKAPTAGVDLTKARFVMDQRNLTFFPHVLPVLVGSKVHFPNHDKVNHNVFSLSRTKKFNLGSYGPGESKTVLFDQPGIVELRCDVHAEMAAYILVLKNPFWAVTDLKGRFEFPDTRTLQMHGIEGVRDVPAGKYRLKTWHEKLKTGSKAVVVPKDGEVDIQLNLSRGVPGVLYK